MGNRESWRARIVIGYHKISLDILIISDRYLSGPFAVAGLEARIGDVRRTGSIEPKARTPLDFFARILNNLTCSLKLHGLTMAHSSTLPILSTERPSKASSRPRLFAGASCSASRRLNVLVRYGTLDALSPQQRARKPRLWRNLATAAAFVREELGIARFEVDASSRPDAARKRPISRAHEAKARKRRTRRMVWERWRNAGARRQRRGAMVFRMKPS